MYLKPCVALLRLFLGRRDLLRVTFFLLRQRVAPEEGDGGALHRRENGDLELDDVVVDDLSFGYPNKL